ncbi:hypothetical protein Cob_v003246 [Colletotrichum orbiculare MAFF 240422]|uniref:Uncharacterized protein n=1 Tax=Colletotrichum orbiculare (strain 104-T / ATCC 96160 / CBS 514.97 / LARS 414 / MAFF 240422) TaxID=1213857 RepID=N4UQ05_COLOR|nr:hypothetical protein Cob_v003246 [Colletotrichum orbiculare MAFF 240422]
MVAQLQILRRFDLSMLSVMGEEWTHLEVYRLLVQLGLTTKKLRQWKGQDANARRDGGPLHHEHKDGNAQREDDNMIFRNQLMMVLKNRVDAFAEAESKYSVQAESETSNNGDDFGESRLPLRQKAGGREPAPLTAVVQKRKREYDGLQETDASPEKKVKYDESSL